MSIMDKKICSILSERGLIARNRIDAILKKVSAANPLERILLEEKIVGEEDIAKAIAEGFGLEYADTSSLSVKPALNGISPELMRRYVFVPIRKDKDRLLIAVHNPADIIKIDELEVLLNSRIDMVVTTRSAIDNALKRLKEGEEVFREISGEFRFQMVKETEEGDEVVSLEKIRGDESPIIKLVDSAIYNAVEKRASDIHLETAANEVIIKYRIDGVLYPAMEPIEKKYHSSIISRIKIMSELDIAEKRVPQDGRFKLKIDSKIIDFRVSIMPSIFGEDAVIRILDKEHLSKEFAKLSLDGLGFEGDLLAKIRKNTKKPYGMILVTGPTGSGKTTTLYAAIIEINNSEEKIITIEDPVEYQLPDVLQVPVNEKKGLTFARGLRSILRHDPDKIMVGEMRDSETAQIAVQSALTGHLVFTTVHANNVIDVIGRLLNMGVEPYNFVSALNCILAQRLVRNICPACKEPVKAPRELLQESGLDADKYKDHAFYEGRGCSECNNTGYHGRTAIAEFLELSDTIREMILERRPFADIKKRAKEEGMVFLRESAIDKVFKGKTTFREINRVTFVES
ncbi:MAG: pilus assembly protein PilB [Deltaproteobacteria bacterium RIFCSPLOWO2_02_44_9]|nr:MAG: pilus assembly protein PilB [Deltaproteobacteria bacterium RIFCSPLOWO2_02_44_9]